MNFCPTNVSQGPTMRIWSHKNGDIFVAIRHTTTYVRLTGGGTPPTECECWCCSCIRGNHDDTVHTCFSGSSVSPFTSLSTIRSHLESEGYTEVGPGELFGFSIPQGVPHA